MIEAHNDLSSVGHPLQPHAPLINPHPRKVTSLPRMNIVQITATNNATAVLNNLHEVKGDVSVTV